MGKQSHVPIPILAGQLQPVEVITGQTKPWSVLQIVPESVHDWLYETFAFVFQLKKFSKFFKF